MSEILFAAVAAELAGRGLPEVELFHKQGRSRRTAVGPAGRASSVAHEEGWAVRAGGPRSSLFSARTGAPDPAGPWPEAAGRPLLLAEPRSAPSWTPPLDLAEPMSGEAEGVAILDGIARELHKELPGARLVAGSLEEGTSETAIYSTRGVRAGFRSRAAALRVEVAGPGGRCRAGLHLAEREARHFDPSATARRLADYLVIAEQGQAPAGAGEIVLAPPVTARLLAGLSPLWVGRRAAERAAPFLDAEGRIGRPVVSLLDDGRWRGGVLEAPVDGEGVPTGATILVEDGTYRQPLRHWSEADATVAGCSVRASWRDLPRPGLSHLALRPDPAVAPADLLAGVGRGHYLLDVTDAGRFSLADDRFALPVCGFAFAGGRPVAPVAGAWLVGPAGSLLRHVEAVARDLAFFPLAGMIGAPTVLLSGLEVLPAPPRGAA